MDRPDPQLGAGVKAKSKLSIGSVITLPDGNFVVTGRSIKKGQSPEEAVITVSNYRERRVGRFIEHVPMWNDVRKFTVGELEKSEHKAYREASVVAGG